MRSEVLRYLLELRQSERVARGVGSAFPHESLLQVLQVALAERGDAIDERRTFSIPLPDLGIAFHMELGNSGKYG